ncbi:hypothetical protein ACLOJK_028544 [Asimina triloba]
MGFHLLAYIFFHFLCLSPFSYSINVRRWREQSRSLSLSVSVSVSVSLFLSSSREAATTFDSHLTLKKSDVLTSSVGFDPTRVTQLSWHPRAFLYSGFLTDAECDHLITLARDKLEVSMVADNESGKSVKSEVRTSSGMFLRKKQAVDFTQNALSTDRIHEMKKRRFVASVSNVKNQGSTDWKMKEYSYYTDEIVSRIEGRIAAWTFLPEGTTVACSLVGFVIFYSCNVACHVTTIWHIMLPENGESIQILHYEHGQKYEPHFDYFHDKANQEHGGHRVATVLMYLSNIEMGGETIFPNAEGKDSQSKDDTWSDCAKNGIAVKPKKGDALLFFSLHPDASTDADSLHGSCPVIKGEKWSATKWIHVKSFDAPVKHESSGDCVDEHELCSHWAAAGECQKNPLYMVGSPTSGGFCRKSCNVCKS